MSVTYALSITVELEGGWCTVFVRNVEWLISSSLNSVNLYVESCNYFGMSELTILKQKDNLTVLKYIKRKQIIRESGMAM
jgi:hypothetical protein